MRTIFLIVLLSIGSIQIIDATPENSLLAYSVSYKKTPSSLKKQKRRHLTKKRKKVNFRARPKPEQDQESREKIRKSFIIAGIFTFLFLGFAIGAGVALTISGSGFLGLLAGIPLVLLALGALVVLIVFFRKGSKLLKKEYNSTAKKTDEDLKNEVSHLSEEKANRYVELKNQLTSVNINKENFYRNLRTRLKAGVKFKDLVKELNGINKEQRTLKRAIKRL